MARCLAAVGVALAILTALMTPANAARYSAWSAPINLGPAINTTAGEDQPAISKDGLSLYFQSGREGGYGSIDLYVSRRNSVDEEWGSPINLGPAINSPSLELVPTLSRDGHYLFFVSPRLTGLADIFVSYREHVHDDLAWQPPVMLGPEINTSFADTSPAFFENDDYGRPQLYFNSNRPGGMGFMDIYMTEMRADGTMSPAVLVPELSSAYNDVTPDISRDGLQMFFQSNRPGGSGNTDLWTSVRSSVLSPWSPPENMGTAVNSSATESGPSISSDGRTLFFASNRAGGGGVDIYMMTRTSP